MIPGSYDLTIYQGDTFRFTFRLRESVSRAFIDLTGCTVSSQIRALPSSATPLVAFAGVVEDQVAMPGGATLSLTPTETAGLAATGDGDSYVWDVQIIWPGGAIETYLRGNVTVLAQVTR